MPMVEFEYQALLAAARQAFCGDGALEQEGKRRLRDFAAHSARSRLDSARKSAAAAGPRKLAPAAEQRLARRYWTYVAENGARGAQQHFSNEEALPLSTLKDILKRNPKQKN